MERAPQPFGRPTAALLALALVSLSSALLGGAPEDDERARGARVLLERYCFDCHGRIETRGEVDLARASEQGAPAEPELWGRVREQLELDEMPPRGHARPSAGEHETILGWVLTRVGSEPRVAPLPAPGRPRLRRLNHVEYRRTVRELFGVDIDVQELFPPDEIAHGFDTVGEALSLPDLLLERYLEAAERVAALAIAIDDPARSAPRIVEPDRFSGDGQPREDAWVLSSVGEVGASLHLPRSGEYALRVLAGAQQAGPEKARMALRVSGKELGRYVVETDHRAPAAHELRTRLDAGEQRITARFLNDYYRPEDPDPENRDRNLWIHRIELEGPLDAMPRTPFQDGLLRRFGPELGTQRRRAILEHLVTLAWRRPPAEEELARIEALVSAEAELERALQLALEALLVSPSFLFRPEPDPPAEGGVRELTGHELATRLAYFVWSSPPDEALLERAARGELRTEEGLRAELARMLDSPRSFALAEEFAMQWLQLRRLATHAPDRERFPSYDERLRTAMLRESQMLFDAVLREGRSAWELLEADFGFVNGALAAHYGIAGVEGEEMRRVSLAGLPRRGLLTQASVLTATSESTRTAPVKRGKWILETLLGAPPPPPPPEAGNLDESPEAAGAASLRERLERHRSDPACAVCHATLDPLGFGLESYDAIGRWRESDGPFAIDARGELPDGRSFQGALELVAILRADDAFLRTLLEKLLVYALGRGLGSADRSTIDGILGSLDPDRPSLRGMIEGIVLSAPFRKRSVAPPAPDPR